ncbi:TniQ family protein [Pseudoxanthomonas sp. PXM02]|nr:TniQ family protein [Pseudoxanthomonas sp. PXM02]
MARLTWVAGIRVRDVLAGYQLSGTPPVSAICGPGYVYLSSITDLKRATGVDSLHCGTVYNLGGITERGLRGLVQREWRWCPVCLKDWDHDTSYELLAWHFHLVVRCPLHECVLVGRCQRCGHRQGRRSSYTTRRDCTHCGASLGGKGEWSRMSPEHAWAHTQMLDIVEFCGNPTSERLDGSAFTMLASSVLTGILLADDASENARQVVARVGSATNAPSLDFELLLNMCALQGVRLCDALHDPLGGSSKPFLSMWETFQPIDLRIDGMKLRSQVFETLLSELIESPKSRPLPSLWLLAQELGLSEHTEARYRTANWRRYGVSCLARSGKKELQQRVDAAFAKLSRLAGMEGRLTADSLTRRRFARQAIQDRALGRELKLAIVDSFWEIRERCHAMLEAGTITAPGSLVRRN